MHQRTALRAREDSFVDLLGVLLLAKNEPSARSAKCLVRGRSHDVRIRYGRRMDSRRDETGNVSHIDHEIRADAVRNLAESLEVDKTRVSACTRKYEARLAFLGESRYLVVINEAGVFIHGVRHNVEVLARNVDGAAVRKMTAVRETHAQHGVARLQQREEYRKICVGAAMSLDVGMLCAEQRLGAVDSETLDDVHVFADAVISLAGIALGIFVGEVCTHRRHDSGRNYVLAGDQLDVVLLSFELVLHRGEEFGVFLMNGLEVDHKSLLDLINTIIT